MRADLLAKEKELLALKTQQLERELAQMKQIQGQVTLTFQYLNIITVLLCHFLLSDVLNTEINIIISHVLMLVRKIYNISHPIIPSESTWRKDHLILFNHLCTTL